MNLLKYQDMNKTNATGMFVAAVVGFAAYKVVTSKPVRRYLLGLLIAKTADFLKHRYT